MHDLKSAESFAHSIALRGPASRKPWVPIPGHPSNAGARPIDGFTAIQTRSNDPIYLPHRRHGLDANLRLRSGSAVAILIDQLQLAQIWLRLSVDGHNNGPCNTVNAC